MDAAGLGGGGDVLPGAAAPGGCGGGCVGWSGGEDGDPGEPGALGEPGGAEAPAFFAPFFFPDPLSSAAIVPGT